MARPCGIPGDAGPGELAGRAEPVEMREQEGVGACLRGAFSEAPRDAGCARYNKIKESLNIEMGGSSSGD